MTWSEYYDDFTSNMPLLREKILITEVQFMRWVANCLRSTQRKTEVATATKVIAPSGGAYNLGNDVLTILVVKDDLGNELFSTGVKQDQRLREEEPLGLNEPPMRFSRRRDAPLIDGYGYENRWYARHNNLLTAYPGYTGNLTVLYTIDYHPFSASSSQWAAWFPIAANFNTQFTGTVPTDQQLKFDECWDAYCTMKAYMQMRTPEWTVYKNFLDQATATLISLKQMHYGELTSPYNSAPFD